jgi:hypothetical protein
MTNRWCVESMCRGASAESDGGSITEKFAETTATAGETGFAPQGYRKAAGGRYPRRAAISIFVLPVAGITSSRNNPPR